MSIKYKDDIYIAKTFWNGTASKNSKVSWINNSNVFINNNNLVITYTKRHQIKKILVSECSCHLENYCLIMIKCQIIYWLHN